MDFKKKLKTRLYVAITYIVLGIILIGWGFFAQTNNNYMSYLGLALAVIGCVRIRNYVIITRNDESIKKRQIAETDERNISIMHKARSAAFLVYSLISCAVVITLSVLNLHDIANWIGYSVLSLVVIYWICYWVYQRKL